jgi:hypothetical protein
MAYSIQSPRSLIISVSMFDPVPVAGTEHPLARGRHVKVKFTVQEDSRLLDLVRAHGRTSWQTIATLMGTKNSRQCRERYNNYLNPDLRRGSWTTEEDDLLREKYAEFGPKWNKIGQFFTNRSDMVLRNRWMKIERHRAKNPKPDDEEDDRKTAPQQDARKAASDGFDIMSPGIAPPVDEPRDPWSRFYV